MTRLVSDQFNPQARLSAGPYHRQFGIEARFTLSPAKSQPVRTASVTSYQLAAWLRRANRCDKPSVKHPNSQYDVESGAEALVKSIVETEVPVLAL